MKQFTRMFFVGLGLVMLTACGGGSSDSGGTSSNKHTGQFVDVKGARYETSSGLSGVTGENGEFEYKEGDKVSFYVAEAKLGEVEASQKIDAADFKNYGLVTQILHSFDNDMVWSNGFDVSRFHSAKRLSTSREKKVRKLAKSSSYELNVDEITEYDEKYGLFFLSHKEAIQATSRDLSLIDDKLRKYSFTSFEQKLNTFPFRIMRGDYDFNNRLFDIEQVINNYKIPSYEYRLNLVAAKTLESEIMPVFKGVADNTYKEIEWLKDESAKLQDATKLYVDSMKNNIDATIGAAEGNIEKFVKAHIKTGLTVTELGIKTKMEDGLTKESLIVATSIVNSCLDLQTGNVSENKDLEKAFVSCLSKAEGEAVKKLFPVLLKENYPAWANYIIDITSELQAVGIGCVLDKFASLECYTNALGLLVNTGMRTLSYITAANFAKASVAEQRSSLIAHEIFMAQIYTNEYDYCKLKSFFSSIGKDEVYKDCPSKELDNYSILALRGGNRKSI